MRGSANIRAELRERESELVGFDIGVSKKIEGHRLTANIFAAQFNLVLNDTFLGRLSGQYSPMLQTTLDLNDEQGWWHDTIDAWASLSENMYVIT